MADLTVRRIDFGYFVRPAQETGTGDPRVEPCLGYGNPLLGQIPVFVRGTELDTARRVQDYTLPELIEGNRFERVSGQAEVLPAATQSDHGP